MSSRSKRAAEPVALAESQAEWELRFWRALGSDEVSHGASCAVATVSYLFFAGHAGRRRSHESAGTQIFNAHIRNDDTSWESSRALESCRNLVCGMRQRSVDVKIADLRKLARTG